jgi:hypothetical protein
MCFIVHFLTVQALFLGAGTIGRKCRVLIGPLFIKDVPAFYAWHALGLHNRPLFSTVQTPVRPFWFTRDTKRPRIRVPRPEGAIEKENGHGTWRVPVAVKKVTSPYLRTGTLREGIPTPPAWVLLLFLVKMMGVLLLIIPKILFVH